MSRSPESWFVDNFCIDCANLPNCKKFGYVTVCDQFMYKPATSEPQSNSGQELENLRKAFSTQEKAFEELAAEWQLQNRKIKTIEQFCRRITKGTAGLNEVANAQRILNILKG